MRASVPCPCCGREVVVSGPDAVPTRPFCSARCRGVDLGDWLDGRHRIPGRPIEEATEEEVEELLRDREGAAR